MDRVDVLGVSFDPLTPEEAAKRGEELLLGGSGAYVVTPNPEIVFAARKDSGFAEVVNGADLVVADGIGIIYAAKLLGRRKLTKTPGIELGERLIAFCAQKGLGVYLLGSKPGIAEKAGKNLTAKYPGLVISGTHDGYFDATAPIAEEIKETGASLVLVCLGFPKQENWMAQNAAKTGAALHMGLGGSLDVFAGAVKRAPEFWQKLGLEWFYRLIKEPKRIKRMWKLPLFLVLALFKRLTGGR